MSYKFASEKRHSWSSVKMGWVALCPHLAIGLYPLHSQSACLSGP